LVAPIRPAAVPTPRWFWSMTVNGPMTRSDRVATLEEAKAQFQKLGRLEGMDKVGEEMP
jgi:hypothetical protein